MAGKAANSDFAQRFALALEEAGFGEHSLKALGELFAVSPQAVRKWLDGEAIPVSRRAPEIARLLGVRRAWLLDNELPMRALDATLGESGKRYRAGDKPISLSAEEFRLLNDFRALPRGLQQSLIDLLANLKQQRPAPTRRKR